MSESRATSEGREEPVSATNDAAANDVTSAKRSSPARRRTRWVVAALVFLGITAPTVALVARWSVARHHQLAREGFASKVSLEKTKLFVPGMVSKRYKQFRVPAIVRTPQGHLLAFAEARIGGDDWTGIEIVARRSEDDGRSWSKPYLVLSKPGFAVGSPTPIVDQERKLIFLAYRRSRRLKERIEVGAFVARSDDDGLSFRSDTDLTGPGALLPEGVRPGYTPILTGPGHGIQIVKGRRRGRLIFPVHLGFDTRAKIDGGHIGESFAVYTDDHGETWRFTNSIDYGGDHSIVETEEEGLLTVVRTRAYANSKRTKRITRSDDAGNSWRRTEQSSALVEPVCQASTLRHPYGGPNNAALILYASPSVRAKDRWDKSARKNLKIWASTDDGHTWRFSKLVHEGGAGYSDMAVGPQGTVHLVYETGTEGRSWSGEIMAARFDVQWLDGSLGGEPEPPLSEKIHRVFGSGG